MPVLELERARELERAVSNPTLRRRWRRCSSCLVVARQGEEERGLGSLRRSDMPSVPYPATAARKAWSLTLVILPLPD